MKRVQSWVILGVAVLSIGLPKQVRADIFTVEVFASPAPNVFGSPSYVPWAANAINALQNGLNSVGNPATDPTAYYQVTQGNDRSNIVTGFPSWMGVADPGTAFGSAFSSELGNRLHFGLHIVDDTPGGTFSLSQLNFDMESTDPSDIFQFVGSFDATDVYNLNRVGIALDNSIVDSGSATQQVKELDYVGVGNALAPSDVGCNSGTNQQQLDCAAAFYDSIEPFSITTTYSLTDPSTGGTLAGTTGSGTVQFAATPEPGSIILLATMIAGLLLLRQPALRRKLRSRLAVVARAESGV